jgi:hypothetical protein
MHFKASESGFHFSRKSTLRELQEYQEENLFPFIGAVWRMVYPRYTNAVGTGSLVLTNKPVEHNISNALLSDILTELESRMSGDAEAKELCELLNDPWRKKGTQSTSAQGGLLTAETKGWLGMV